MKEKRYFYDVMMDNEEPTKKQKVLRHLATLILFFVVLPITCIVSYNITMYRYSHELNGYSSSKFERLEEIANIVIKEGANFDLAAIPKDVSSYDITYANGQIIFNYYLINSEEFKFAPSISMTITLSEDLKILEKTSVYEFEKTYIEQTKFTMCILSILNTLIIIIPILILFLVIMFVFITISYFHKKRDQKILSTKNIKETEN